MRNLSSNCFKWDKKYFFAFLITLFCAIICGIVLYKPVTYNTYFIDFTSEYVFNVFCYRNTELLLQHIISDLIYLYIIFLICYFTRLKYLTLVFVFLRGLFFGIYISILFGISSFGGAIVGIFVFIPATLVSVALIYIVAESCKIINKKYVLFMPLALSLIDLIVYAVLINIVFRVIIAIV